MPTPHELRNDLTQAKKDLLELETLAHKYDAKAKDIRLYIEMLTNMEKLVSDKKVNEPIDSGDNPRVHAHKGKTNAKLYEEILTIHGRPMHITDLLDSALKLGLEQKGNSEPLIQLRNSLNGARKRFYNVGESTWWIVGKPIPGDEPPDDGDQNTNSQ